MTQLLLPLDEATTTATITTTPNNSWYNTAYLYDTSSTTVTITKINTNKNAVNLPRWRCYYQNHR